VSAERPLALVTGGCRRLGAAICVGLAEAGYDIALHSSPASAPEEGLGDRLESAGARWRHLTADLSDEAAVAGLVPGVVSAFGRAPVLLVNNAARFEQDMPQSVTQGALIDHYLVNCAAPLLLAKAIAAKGMPAAIVNILDQRIVAPHGDQFSYTLSKLALAEATMILARQFAPTVRVSAVAPGLTLASPDYDEDAMARAAGRMPLGLLAKPEEIADAVVWLAGARAVTGQVIFVDGGAHLRQYERDFVFLDGSADEGR
jgi:NAD(P)-dependent dehydrogenase (short-subunit alcohol dehydrogenase family)